MCDVIDRIRSNAKAEATQQERERNVLALVLAGRTDQEIVEWLHLDVQYVQDVRRNNTQ